MGGTADKDTSTPPGNVWEREISRGGGDLQQGEIPLRGDADDSLVESAKEWGDRYERDNRRGRRAWGAVIGLFIGLLILARQSGIAAHWYVVLPIVIGCVVLFAVLFARNREAEAGELATLLLWPEWTIWRRIPWWGYVIVITLLVIVFIVLWIVFMTSMIH